MKFDKDQQAAKFYLLFLLSAVLGLFLYTVAGFWVLPNIVKPLLEKHLSDALRRSVTIEKIAINPYELAFSIQGFKVRDQNATSDDQNGTNLFLAFDELYTVVQGGSLLERAPILKEVRLSGPYARITRKTDGRFNFSDLLESPAPPPQSLPETPPASTSKADANASGESSGKVSTTTRVLRFSAHNVQITGGMLDFDDESKGEKEHIENFCLALPLVSSLGEAPGGGVHLAVEAKVNESSLSVVARGKPFAEHPEWAVDMKLEALDVTDFAAYLPPELQIKVRSGLVDAEASLSYAQTDNGTAVKVLGETSLRDFEVVDPNEASLLKLPRVKIGLESFEPLTGKLHLSGIVIESPDLALWRNQDGTLNVQKLFAAGGTKQEDDNTGREAAGFQVVVDAIEIADGRIAVTDHAVEPAFHSSLEKLGLSIKGFTNAPGSKAAITFNSSTGDNGTIAIEGTLSPDPLLWEGRVMVSGLALASYAPYYQKQILFELLDGRLAVASTVHAASTGREMQVGVTDLTSSLTSLKLKKAEEPENFLEIPDLEIKGAVLNLVEKTVTIGELSSQSAKLTALRDDKGKLNLQQLVPPAPPTTDGDATEAAGPGTGSSAWKVLLQKLVLHDHTVRFEDRMVSEPTTFLVDQLNFEGRDLVSGPEGKPTFTLSCRVNEKGAIQVEGEVKPSPFFAGLNLNLKDLELPIVQPYVPPDIKVKIKAGKLSGTGKLLLAVPRGGELNGSYVGNVLLSDFSSTDALAGEPLLAWKSLEMKGIDAGNNPARTSIKRIDWKDFFARIAISAEGKINVLQLLGTETGAEAAGDTTKAPAGPGKTAEKDRASPGKPVNTARQKRQAPPSGRKAEQQPAAVSIDQIVLQDGTFSFSDNLIKPNVHAQMSDVGGTISGLSSRKDMLADVNLRGKLYRSSPLEITGKLRPFPEDLYADLNVSFKNIDMTRWDPYARKYVGYTLEKGNLHMDLKYLLAKKELDAQNNIVLDRLTLGDKVDSPEATTLPVKFAISLLQDRKGQIELGIPITGNLDDPQFGLGSTILTFFKNLIMKAITAPFALLGALLPQGVGEIDRIAIVDAGGTIQESSIKKLEALTEILRDRPNLELDIQGTIQTESGRELLRQDLFLKKLKAQKLKELMKKGQAAVALDQVTMAPEELEGYLKMAYDEAFPKQGLDRIRIFKKTPPEEMKNRLLSTIEVTDDDLRALAYEWALKLKEYLQETGKIEPRRLFLVEPALVGPADQAKAKENGVDLKLK